MTKIQGESMDWISILHCPITGQDLRRMTEDEIISVNAKIGNQEIWDVSGSLISSFIEDGLITKDESFMFPIRDGVVLLLSDNALVDSRDKVTGSSLNDEKKLVKDFYDSKGWQKVNEDDYEDADIFEDRRPYVREYLNKCHERVGRHINDSGKYLLDAASGALQHPEYLKYSENYDYRICVDLSFQGLVESKQKLGDKAICLLADITNLPIKEKMVDGFVSINTIYHIPRDEQVKAITELYRVLMPEGKGVVVYDWYKYSPWMNVALLPFRALEFFKHRIMNVLAKLSGKQGADKMLYFHAHNYPFFEKNLPMPFKVACWRSVSVPFMKVYVHKFLFGKKILDSIYRYEEENPELCGLKGEYPMFVFDK